MSKRIPIIFGLLLVLMAMWLLITSDKSVRLFIDHLDKLGYDLQLRLHVLTEQHERHSPIAIIDIDDKSLQSQGRWPWPRSKMAQLTQALHERGAAVIAFDIFFSENQANIADDLMKQLSSKGLLTTSLAETLKKAAPLFDEDATFAESLAKANTTLAISFLPREQTQNLLPPPLVTLNPKEENELGIIKAFGYISNIPALQQAAKNAGFINVFPDIDGIVRRAPLIIQYKGGVYPSLALEAALIYLNKTIDLVTPSYGEERKLEGIHIGDTLIPTDEHGQVLIPFIGKSYTFPYYSAEDVFNGTIPEQALKGKILFVGTSATGLGDLQATSIESPFPGVEIQATIVNGMLQNNFSYVPAWTFGANLVGAFLIGLLSALLFPYLGPRTLGTLIVLFPIALILLNDWIWQETRLILSTLMPILLILSIGLVNIIYGYLFETRRRERLKGMFGQYVPEKHIDEMLQSSGDYALGGEDRDMSVLFADIRNFTTISEGLSAQELVDMLNAFFTPMTEIIFNHRGTIDKYVGDLIMAFWGAPLRSKYHARNAIQSALEMVAKVNELNQKKSNQTWPDLHIGIGINSGIMSVGDMGSRFRRNYTVLGDAVNLASRVEGLTKFYGVDIIVTEETQAHQTKYLFRKLDKVKVKGKTKSIDLYEVLGLTTDETPELKAELSEYDKALQLYLARQWDEAQSLFQALQTKWGHKKIYQIYLARIREFKVTPPPADWNGEYVHTSK